MPDYDFRTLQKGDQLATVLGNNLVHTLEASDPAFVQTARDVITRFGLKPGIEIVKGKQPLRKVGAACVHDGTHQVQLSETFLSYLWCMSYSLLAFYDTLLSSDDSPVRTKARQAFDYAMSLVSAYAEWPDAVPNPVFGVAADQTLVEKVNAVFCYAANFVLLHEIGHVACGHTQVSAAVQPRWQLIDEERQADRWAWEHGFTSPVTNQIQLTRQFGGAVAVSALLMLNKALVHSRHPDSDERIKNALTVIAPEPVSHCRLLVLQGVRLWEQYHGRPLEWIAANSFEAIFEGVLTSLSKHRETDEILRISARIR
ncbi:hypothetical protein DB347_20270 [Opitutaceae bacterium EW11]|nr:hypothetical protein DB347_20270 [Opitutaceae bacterium EW11]